MIDSVSSRLGRTNCNKEKESLQKKLSYLYTILTEKNNNSDERSLKPDQVLFP
jgi:hypothetical protein